MTTWEGSKRDKMQDRKLARRRKMSMYDWERSMEDREHDRPKGMSAGGRVRGAGAAKKGLSYKVS